jgi:hypothetical protein
MTPAIDILSNVFSVYLINEEIACISVMFFSTIEKNVYYCMLHVTAISDNRTCASGKGVPYSRRKCFFRKKKMKQFINFLVLISIILK